MKLTSIRRISQYTRLPTIRQEMPLTHIRRWIKEHEELGQEVVVDPEFQRGISWKPNQQTAFIEYILQGGQSARDIFFNCKDYTSASQAPIVLVDGKQRLFSILQFVANKVPAFGSYYKEFSDRKLIGRKSLIFNINTLETEEEVLRWFLDLNETGVPHSKTHLAKVKQLIEQQKQPYHKKKD